MGPCRIVSSPVPREGRRGGVLMLCMHGRRRMTNRPSLPYMPGRGTHVGFSPTMQTLLAPKKREAREREVFSESHERVRTAASYQEALVRRRFLHMDDSVEYIYNKSRRHFRQCLCRVSSRYMYIRGGLYPSRIPPSFFGKN